MTDKRRPPRVSDQMLRRIRAEYLEMPGLCLTLEQAERLWSLDEETCRKAMRILVDTHFLCGAVPDPPGLVRGSALTFRRLPARRTRVSA